MSGFPHRARVPARTPGTAAANPDPDRRIRTRRARPHGRDEPAGADQPEPDDQRGREDRDRGHGHHPCELTTPTTSSPPPAAEPPPHAAGPSPQSVGWTMQDNRFHSTRWRAKGRSPGPGSTTSPTCAPRSNDSAPGEIQGPPGTVFRTGNAHPTLPSGADSRLRPNETASWRPRTDTYARHLRSPSANCAQPPSRSARRHADQEISTDHRTLLTHASTTLATEHRRRSTSQASTRLKITFGEVLQLVGHLRAGTGGQVEVVQ